MSHFLDPFSWVFPNSYSTSIVRSVQSGLSSDHLFFHSFIHSFNTAVTMVAQTHNKTMLVNTPFGRYSKIFIADMQILGSAFCFGIGFLGQRAVMVHGLGPMTCNAFRFGLSTILLVACLPMIPIDEPELESENEEYDGESGQNDGHINGSPRSKSGNEIDISPGSGGLKSVSRDVGENNNNSAGSSSSSSSNNKRPNSSGSKSSSNANASMSSSSSSSSSQSQSQSQSQQQSTFSSSSSNANASAIGGAAKKVSVLLKLLGPVGVTKVSWIVTHKYIDAHTMQISHPSINISHANTFTYGTTKHRVVNDYFDDL